MCVMPLLLPLPVLCGRHVEVAMVSLRTLTDLQIWGPSPILTDCLALNSQAVFPCSTSIRVRENAIKADWQCKKPFLTLPTRQSLFWLPHRINYSTCST